MLGGRVANTSGTETDTQASATCFQACSRPAPSGQDNAAAGAPARGMCSNDVHLTVLRRCGTDVAGLWVSGGSLLRSSTGCTLSRRCAGHPHAPRAVVPCCASPRLAQAPIPVHLPAQLLSADVCTLVHTSEIGLCCLCFACRWDVRRQFPSLVGTTRSPCSRCVTELLASRCWTCCRLAAFTRDVQRWGLLAFRARARLQKRRSRPVHATN